MELILAQSLKLKTKEMEAYQKATDFSKPTDDPFGAAPSATPWG